MLPINYTQCVVGYFICAILHIWHLQRRCWAVFNKLKKNDQKTTKSKLKNLFCKSWPDVESTCDHMWARRAETCGFHVDPMSKVALGQCGFPTLDPLGKRRPTTLSRQGHKVSMLSGIEAWMTNQWKERSWTLKQVAQRATIAHLSPTCQHPLISKNI